jgi:arginyl-tRNA synthetase
VITRDLRYALRRALAAAGLPADADPGLRPAGVPGSYAASVALSLGADPRAIARSLAATLTGPQRSGGRWIARAEVTGPGYLTVTVTQAALAAVADRVSSAGAACVTSDALAGVTVPAAPAGDPLAAATWEGARAALAARLTARLAAAAGATVADSAPSERVRPTLPGNASSSAPPPKVSAGGGAASPCAAAAFAGRDAVMFTLARAVPGRPLTVDRQIIARHVPGNPAYAVRYAHARAASGVRWAAASSAADTIGSGETRDRLLADPTPELFAGGDGGSPLREAAVLLDALSWLPERVATAARRGRPDEFARYLEDLASVTATVLSSPSHLGNAAAPGSDRLTLAKAARTGLAAGLGLLEVTAPERLWIHEQEIEAEND